MSTLLKTLGSYVPSLLVRRAVNDPSQFSKPTVERFPAAVLFADVSGFTALTERLASRGAAGAEDLVSLLNAYFGQLIDLVTSSGGDIVKFAGDAVLALWRAESESDLPRLAQQIAQCCIVAQSRLHNYAVADDVRLSMKLAIGVGDVLNETLGGVFGRWEFLVAGSPLSQVGEASHHASPGDIYVSPEAWALLKDVCEGHAEEDGNVKLSAVREEREFETAAPPVPTPEAAAALRAFIPGAIRSRIDAGQTDWLAELRRVTVLFINLPDFNYDTPLEQAQEAMHALQTNLYRYEGSINKISVDDKGASLVAALGLPPLSHEDDAARGIRAAMAMQRELRKLGMRSAIGVTTGLAFCGSIGNAKRREYTLMGDVVNLSARLMQAAPGDILCDEHTAKGAMDRLTLNALEPIKVKGKKDPIAIYRPAADAAAAPSKASVPKSKTAMVGRTKERAFFEDQIEALIKEGKGGRIAIEGEAGIGKSRLMEEIISQAHEKGLLALLGAGDSIEKSTSYYPWRRVFNQLFGIEGLPDDAAVKRTHVLHQLPHDHMTLQLSPLLNAVLPFDWPDNEFTKQMTGKTRADGAQEILVRILQAAADRSPLALVIEDAHWFDSGSLALLLLVAQRVQPLLMVVSTRPMSDPIPPDFSQFLNAPTTQKLTLENMPVEETLELVCRRLCIESLPEQISEIIRDKAEGNPFFSEELAFAMRDSGLIIIADGKCAIAPDAGAAVTWTFPDTVQGVITSRIDRLGPSEQMTMKVASVIGRVFAYRTLYDVYPIDKDKETLSSHFNILLSLDLTPLERPAPDLAYLFKHAITHDVAYNLMLFSQRRLLHRAVAQWYESAYANDLSPYYPYLAYHWRKAAEDRTPDPALVWKAVDYLQKAGDHAVHNYINQEAIGFFSEAIELLNTIPDSPEKERRELQLQLAVGAPMIATRGYAAEEVKQAYSRARELCARIGDNTLLFPSLRGLWAYYIGHANYHAAREIGAELLRLAVEENDPSILLEAHRAMGNTVFWFGELEAAQEHMQEGIALYAPDEHRTLAFLYGQDPDVANRGMQAWPLALMGYPEQAIRRGVESIAHARQISHPYSLGYAFVHDMCCMQYLRLVDEALERADQAIALGTEKGFPNWLLAGVAVKGWALAQKGMTDEGIAQLDQVIMLWRGTGSELVLPYFLTMLGESYGKAGKFAEGIAAIDDALSVAEKNDDHWYEAEMYRLKGEYLLETGDVDGERWIDRAVDLARRQRARLLELRASASLSRLRLKRGRKDEARELLSEICGWFTEGLNLPDLKEAKLILDEI